ncbi:MAG: hypothetical protein DSM107014_01625 [Gomphosphaeria aponina SAG 52.96 = DSM 107014]|uniref:Uncharacterized protein n=1 Tax=Gomphosphaeria aponina SAG 52.96 = DSM 107014 TaxID=1521640 RepID=A0A941JUF5_9CHRO|nr:hypothetical protein [Gomphosphaeria aponina SAG 52.96 = DSM 107014]
MVIQRWTDEMLDELASSVTEMREGMTEMREGMTELKEGTERLRVTSQALLQLAAQHQERMNNFEQELELTKQRQAENDQRFNILLEEVRYLIRGNQGEKS